MIMAGNYVAATMVALSGQDILPASRVQRNVNGIVLAVVPLDDFCMEPASTPYYSGLITADVIVPLLAEGVDVRTIVQPLAVGYSGRLLLWQHLSLCNFKITSETVVREI